MKKSFLVLGFVAIGLLSSCDNGAKERERQAEQQQRLQDSVNAVMSAKDLEVEQLFQQLNEIEENLSEVSSKYKSVSSVKNKSSEVSASVRNRISNHMADINQIMEQNRKKMASLNSQLAKSKKQYGELSEFVTKLESRISEQEQQIQALTEELQQKKIVIETLSKNIDDLTLQHKNKEEQLIKEQESKNTAYYVVGAKQELRNQKIIDKKGGFIGIGARNVVNTDVDLSIFNKIDIRSVQEIPLSGGKVKILTSHPSASYLLEGDEKRPTSLKILNPELFWQQSKFLVITVD